MLKNHIIEAEDRGIKTEEQMVKVLLPGNKILKCCNQPHGTNEWIWCKVYDEDLNLVKVENIPAINFMCNLGDIIKVKEIEIDKVKKLEFDKIEHSSNRYTIGFRTSNGKTLSDYVSILETLKKEDGKKIFLEICTNTTFVVAVNLDIKENDDFMCELDDLIKNDDNINSYMLYEPEVDYGIVN